MWSSGCVVAEMLTATPLFPGATSAGQIVEIVSVLGASSIVNDCSACTRLLEVLTNRTDGAEWAWLASPSTKPASLLLAEAMNLNLEMVGPLLGVVADCLRYCPDARPCAAELRERLTDKL